jgi:hypothetical protein
VSQPWRSTLAASKTDIGADELCRPDEQSAGESILLIVVRAVGGFGVCVDGIDAAKRFEGARRGVPQRTILERVRAREVRA